MLNSHPQVALNGIIVKDRGVTVVEGHRESTSYSGNRSATPAEGSRPVLERHDREDPCDASRATRNIIELVGTEFDVAYYLRTYPEVARTPISPIEHYVLIGWAEGKNPNAEFDTHFYVSSNPDVFTAGVNPFYHYLAHGRGEGRLPHPEVAGQKDTHNAAAVIAAIEPEFDEIYYLCEYPESAATFPSSVEHYVQIGWRQGKNPTAGFDTDFYLATNPDVRSSGINPFFHYLKWGRHEGRRPTAIDLANGIVDIEEFRTSGALDDDLAA